MEITTRTIRGTGGETIHVNDFGAPDGTPVLVHAGSPGSRRLYRPDVELATNEFGLRLLSYDRPGYGGRPRHEGRQVAEAVTDVRLIAEALGIGRLGMWGVSGGGCYALACAALLPGLVSGAAVFASFAPYGAPGLDFGRDLSPGFRDEVDLFFADRPTARARWRADADKLFATRATPEGWLVGWGDAAGTDDAHGAAGTDDAHGEAMTAYLAAGIRDALTDGDDGWWDDWAAVLTPWGCDLTAIDVPVRLWHGARDQAVPVSHGHWLADHIPGIIAEFPATDDHMTVEHNNQESAYAWLRTAG